MSGKKQVSVWLSAAVVGVGVAQAVPIAPNPWADEVIQYLPGAGANPAYGNPATVLGAPTRVTGEQFGFPGAVTMFNPAFGTNEILSIGTGGFVEVRFDEPITNDAGNLFGIDLIVFGNEGFIDDSFPAGQQGDPAGVFSNDLMDVEVSADGSTWVPVGAFQEGFFPTQAYLDVPPQSPGGGLVKSTFTRPMDPSLTLSDFDGLSYAQSLALYDGSGGGTPIDIAATGLSAVSFVRISNTSGSPIELDSIAAVPEPATGLVLVGMFVFALWRKG